MTEYSFPVVNEPLSAAQWGAVTRGIGSGVLDNGDGPYVLANISNANNTVDITASTGEFAQAIVAGFYHRIDADVTLSIPAVTAPTTYYIALQFDPLRTTTPVQLGVFTSLDESQGKEYLVLHEIDREPNQLLSDAAHRWVRPRVAPTIVVSRKRELPPAESVLWGTVAVCHNDNIATGESELWMSFTTEWKRIYDQSGRFEWEELGDNPAWQSPVGGNSYKWAIGRRGAVRKMRGRFALVSGPFQPGVAYNFPLLAGVLPASDKPSHTQAFTTVCGITAGKLPLARFEISSVGDITMWVSETANWASLDGVEWEVA